MKLSTIVTVFVCLSTVRLSEGSQCICVYSRNSLHRCQNAQQQPVAFIEQDGEGNNCLLAEPNVITQPGWRAGIYIDLYEGYQQLVYLRSDTFVKDETCQMQRSSGNVVYEHTCTNLQPGTSINGPTTPNLPTFTTAPTTRALPTFTTAPTTRALPTFTTAPTTRALPIFTKAPTTRALPTFTTAPKATATSLHTPTKSTATPASTQAPVFVPVTTPKPSDKCDWIQMMRFAQLRTPAMHASSRHCLSGINGDSEALLLNACRPPHSRYFQTWRSDVKVMDNCYGIPKGEPIGLYVGNGLLPRGIHAAFWQCTGTSFTVMFQSCGNGFPIIGDVRMVLNTPPEMFYTIQW